MKILLDQYQGEWFPLPKDLFQRYAERLGINGLAVYAFLAAHVDDSFTCVFPDEVVPNILVLTKNEFHDVLQVLKDTRLVKTETYGVNQTAYTLLWQPCPLDKGQS